MGGLRDHRYWGMRPFKGGKDCPIVVQLYAKLGLHRYNILEVYQKKKKKNVSFFCVFFFSLFIFFLSHRGQICSFRK